MRHTLLLFFIAALLILAGCDRRPAASGKPVVVVTIYPLAAVVQQIVGDEAEVVCMLPPGMSPHAYDQTASNMAALTRADLVVANGLGLDHWVRGAVEATGRKDVKWFVLADVVKIEADADHDHDHHHHHDHAGHDHHHHGPVDPHLWLDPMLMQEGAAELFLVLGDVLGTQHSELLSDNTATLVQQINSLHDEYIAKLAEHKGAKIVTFHDAFGRLAERYGLEVAATLRPMSGPEAVTPEARALVKKTIETHGLRAVFAEPQFSQDSAKMIEAQTGAKVLVLDPLGSPLEEDRSTYVGLMRYNLNTLLQGLSAE